jgi:DNA mismatch repair ATPase MutL
LKKIKGETESHQKERTQLEEKIRSEKTTQHQLDSTITPLKSKIRKLKQETNIVNNTPQKGTRASSDSKHDETQDKGEATGAQKPIVTPKKEDTQRQSTKKTQEQSQTSRPPSTPSGSQTETKKHHAEVVTPTPKKQTPPSSSPKKSEGQTPSKKQTTPSTKQKKDIVSTQTQPQTQTPRRSVHGKTSRTFSFYCHLCVIFEGLMLVFFLCVGGPNYALYLIVFVACSVLLLFIVAFLQRYLF